MGVDELVSQAEIYDQVHFAKSCREYRAIALKRELVTELIKRFEAINSVSHSFPQMINKDLEKKFEF